MTSHLWQFIADDIKRAIDSGEFKPDGKLPATDLLARRWEVANTVIIRALDHLTASGILRHAPQGPYLVNGPEWVHVANDPLFLTVAEAAFQARVSKMTIYRLIHDNVIRCTQIGRGFRIHADSWKAYLNGEPVTADTFQQAR